MSVAPPAPPQEAITRLHHAAVELLTIHADHMARERRTRLHLIRAARAAGLSNQAIGDALGITEAAVRHMLTRHGEAA